LPVILFTRILVAVAAPRHKFVQPIPLLGSPEQIDGNPLPNWVIDYLDAVGVRGARDDLDIVGKYLLRLRNRPETFRAYRRDLERFLHWAWQFPRKRVVNITRDDMLGFLKYLEAPPGSWVGRHQVDRYLVAHGGAIGPNPNWTPFVSRTSKAARKRTELGMTNKVHTNTTNKKNHSSKATIRSALAATSWLYWALVSDQAIPNNPAAALMKDEKNKLKTDKGVYERVLTDEQWKACIDAARSLAKTNPAHERTLFIISMLYLLKLRISEISGSYATMNRFRQRKGTWVYRVESGKRGKSRDVPCPDAMLQALRRYRRHIGSDTALPSMRDDSPLLPKVRGTGSLGVREVSFLLQICFDAAARSLVEKKRIDDAFAVVAASAHWLRHTSASEEAHSGRPLVDLQHDLGHDSLGTTSRYLHDDIKRRSASVRNKQL